MQRHFRSGLFERAGARHSAKVTKPWLGPVESASLAIILASITFVLIAMVMNVWIRHAQLDAWQVAPDITLIQGAPSFSTTDAPYFLSHAASIDREEAPSVYNSLRSFPNVQNETTTRQEEDLPANRPLLSVLIASIADAHDPFTLLDVGNKFIIFSAALTALMIAFCFGAAGHWSEGAVAALGGGLSSAYLVRSSIGRIDTDQLNLGFIYLMFGLAVFAGKARSRVRSLAFCCAAGVSAKLFMWWYGKPELIVVVAFVLAWVLLCLQRNAITATVGTLMFLILAGLDAFNPIGSPYLNKVLTEGNFIFPNTFQTISEIQRVPLSQILEAATGTIEMGFVCLAGLALFTVRYPVIGIAYGPLIGFGLLNFLIGNRAIFYSAPILWFGAAFLVTSLVRFLATNLSKTNQIKKRSQSAIIVGASLSLVVAWVNSSTNYVPRPSFPRAVLEGLASLKGTADSQNAVVATWWDYGYASMFFNELPTLHDGGSQTTPTTHFVARAFLEPDESQSIGTLKFLSTGGHKGIAASNSLENLETAFRAAGAAPSPDLFLVVTNQMAGWMGSISKLGNWDIEIGEPIQLRGNADGPEVHYRTMNCRFNAYPQFLNCGGLKIDLQRGLIGDNPLLVGWTHTRDGKVLRHRSFDHDADHAIQIVQDGGRINVHLLHRQLYESTFNKLYYQGVMEDPSISLHYDDYPHIRIYRIDGTPAG